MIGSMNVNGSKAEDYDITFNIADGATADSIFSYNYMMKCTVDIVLNEKIKTVQRMFYNQNYMNGTILFNCYPVYTYQCFYGTGGTNSACVIVNYTAICVNIDSVLSTRSSSTAVVKGILVV